jgi:hypothetical protein
MDFNSLKILLYVHSYVAISFQHTAEYFVRRLFNISILDKIENSIHDAVLLYRSDNNPASTLYISDIENVAE